MHEYELTPFRPLSLLPCVVRPKGDRRRGDREGGVLDGDGKGKGRVRRWRWMLFWEHDERGVVVVVDTRCSGWTDVSLLQLRLGLGIRDGRGVWVWQCERGDWGCDVMCGC